MSNPLRVLFVEDSEADAALLLRQLQHGGYEVVGDRVQTAEGLHAALARQEWDVVLADYSMPQFDAPAALEILRQSGFDTPFIVVSGSIGEEIAVNMMKAGANDYLLKEQLARLLPAVERELREAESRRQRRKTEAVKKRLEAERDQLLERLKQENEDLAALTQITANAISTLELDRLLNTLLERFVAVMRADAAMILLAEGDTLRVRASIGLDLGELANYQAQIGQGFSGTIAATQQPLYVEDAQTDSRIQSPTLKQRGVRSMLGVPLKHRTELVGVLHVDWLQVHPFRQRELHLLEITAERCAAALINARLYEMTRKAEEAARENESLFRSLVETAGDAVLVTDADGRMVLVNAETERVFGYHREELLGQRVEMLVPVALRGEHERLRHHFNTAPRQRTMGGGMALRALRKNGREFPAEISLSPIQTEKGLLVISIIRDITDRRLVEEALRLAEEKYRRLAESAQELIFSASPSGAIEYVNAFGAKLAGLTPEEMIGRTLDELFVGDPLEPHTQAIAAVLASGQPLYREREFTIAGREVWLGTRLVPIVSPGGEWQGASDEGPGLARPASRHPSPVTRSVLGIARDLTEQKRLEQQLLHSQKLDAVGQLAGGVAHDFNNLLTVIQGFTQLLLSEPELSLQQKDYLSQIFGATERAASLTRQLLALSRKQAIQPQLVDLNRVVDGIVKMLRRLIGENIHPQLHLSSVPCEVYADEGMVEQILVNLTINARDAMPRGGELWISTACIELGPGAAERHAEARPGQFVCLTVQDTGCGMTPEVASRIFEPFFTTKEPGRGTGLGLATVYGIVKQHEGWIEVETAVGLGTSFRIFLPYGPRAGAKAEARPPVPEVRGGEETLLLVEDDTLLRTLARVILERYGYRVIEAESGVRALELWEQHGAEVDLLLTDMVMPGGVTGRDLAERFRRLKPALQVVCTSGYSPDITQPDFLLQLGIHFLQKPYRPRELAATVRKCLDERRAGPARQVQGSSKHS